MPLNRKPPKPELEYYFAPLSIEWLYDTNFSAQACRLMSHLARKIMLARYTAWEFNREIHPDGALFDFDEITKLFGVAPRTVKYWIAECKAKGYLIITESVTGTRFNIHTDAKIKKSQFDISDGLEDVLLENAETCTLYAKSCTENDVQIAPSYKEGSNLGAKHIDSIDIESYTTYSANASNEASADEHFLPAEVVKTIGDEVAGKDEKPVTQKNESLTATYIDDTGKKWESFDVYWQSLPADPVNDPQERRAWVNDEGEEDRRRNPQSPIEKQIVRWMRGHGSTIQSLSAQNVNKLKSKLPNSNETLMIVGMELWHAPEVQKRLASVATRAKSGHKTPFSQNEIVNILLDEYQTWRKVRDAHQRDPEIKSLEDALVTTLGFTLQTIAPKSLIYLRDTVIPQLFTAGCRAHHVKPLLDGMTDRKIGFIVTEWTNRGRRLIKNSQPTKVIEVVFEGAVPFGED